MKLMIKYGGKQMTNKDMMLNSQKARLKNMQEAMGLESLKDTASYILENYQMFDYNNVDRLFLAFCEELTVEDNDGKTRKTKERQKKRTNTLSKTT